MSHMLSVIVVCITVGIILQLSIHRLITLYATQNLIHNIQKQPFSEDAHNLMLKVKMVRNNVLIEWILFSVAFGICSYLLLDLILQ